MPSGNFRENLRDAVLDHMRANPKQAMTKSSLARALAIPSELRQELRKTLAALTSEGVIEERKKASFLLCATSGKSLVGTLKFHPKGHALFFPEAPSEAAASGETPLPSRIHVARRDTGTALDGDRVLVSVQRPSPRRKARFPRELLPPPEEEIRGKVEKVLARRSGRLVGVYRAKKNFSWIECDDVAVSGSINLIGETTAQPGQMVVVALESWANPAAPPSGRIIEVLGWPGQTGVEIEAVIHRFGLRTSFPEAILSEARAVPEIHSEAEISRREDWRKRLVITIDPADAKDHDDAIWLEKTPSGWSLAVHIADVSHYIKPGSPMDKEAVERGNSTYLVDRVLPMLPTELSNGICSLKPHVDRLTKCAFLEISSEGKITKARFFDAVINSGAKLSYEEAQAILDGKNPPESADSQLISMVREGWKLASTLRRHRFRAGALDLEMPEIQIKLDAHGHVSSAEPLHHTESHQLIEECMLAANEAVAHILRDRMKPAVYRIHENPDPARLLEYSETATLHGYRPGDLTNRAHIQKLLDEAKGRPEEHLIKIGLLKSLKRASYSAEPIGHYGLAKNDYCHFTSPIRRYADLIVHRALQPMLENSPKNPDRTSSQAELRTLSQHISTTERTSAEAESETRQIKLFEYLEHLSKKREPRKLRGLVTDARPMGLMVEVPSMGLRGVVKREDFPPGTRWRLEAHRMAWVSASGHAFQPGMEISLLVSNVDSIRRFVDFSTPDLPEKTETTLRSPLSKLPKHKHKPAKASKAPKSGLPHKKRRRK